MLKRLSYPLSWVEGLTGEGPTGAGGATGAGGSAPGSQADSLPTSADSHNTSVFSKVFNRYVYLFCDSRLALLVYMCGGK